jgi:hypothetical protein
MVTGTFVLRTWFRNASCRLALSDAMKVHPVFILAAADRPVL